jgi:hypothetical protein
VARPAEVRRVPAGHLVRVDLQALVGLQPQVELLAPARPALHEVPVPVLLLLQQCLPQPPLVLRGRQCLASLR